MEFNVAGAGSASLLQEQELQTVGPVEEPVPDVKAERTSPLEAAITCAAVVVVSLLSALLLYLFVQEWTQETYYRPWLLLAVVALASYAARKVWHRVLISWERWRNIQVVIDSIRGTTLFNAVLERIEQAVEAKSETCSSMVEAFTIYDKTLGRTQVRMRFWGKDARQVNRDLQSRR